MTGKNQFVLNKVINSTNNVYRKELRFKLQQKKRRVRVSELNATFNFYATILMFKNV